MNFFAQIALKFLPAWATTAWPYVAFYLANRQLFKKWIDLSKEIIEKFKREHPDAARVPTDQAGVIWSCGKPSRPSPNRTDT